MNFDKEISELQKVFAETDLLTSLSVRSGSGFMEVLLLRRQRIKIKIYQEVGHNLPHIHIDYGKHCHAASYAIESGERLEGNLSRKYDSDVLKWLERNRVVVLKIWNELQVGEPYEHFLAELVGDV